MPYINIRVAGKLSKEQKAEICAGVTEVVCRVAKKPESTVLIFIDEVAADNIASAGKLLSDPA